MISGQLSPTRPAAADQRPRGPRLKMKPAGSAQGCVDGGWWPWSDDLVAEAPELVSALAPWVGPVSRVSYHLDTWGVVARKVHVQGRIVRFEGFRSMDQNTVVVIGSDSRRVSLLAVPPGLPGTAARAVLRSAAEHDSTASVADTLAATARRRTPTQKPPRSCHTLG